MLPLWESSSNVYVLLSASLSSTPSKMQLTPKNLIISHSWISLPWEIYTTITLSNYMFIDTWVISRYCSAGMSISVPCLNQYLGPFLNQCFCSRFSEVESELSYMEVLFVCFKESLNCFQRDWTKPQSHQLVMRIIFTLPSYQ